MNDSHLYENGLNFYCLKHFYYIQNYKVKMVLQQERRLISVTDGAALSQVNGRQKNLRKLIHIPCKPKPGNTLPGIPLE